MILSANFESAMKTTLKIKKRFLVLFYGTIFDVSLTRRLKFHGCSKIVRCSTVLLAPLFLLAEEVYFIIEIYKNSMLMKQILKIVDEDSLISGEFSSLRKY